MSLSVVIWAQHLLGTGHTVRAGAIARALAARSASVTLALGNTPPATFDGGGVRTLELPPVRATDATFADLAAPDGTPYADLVARRRDALLWLGEPDVFLTESYPLGRRAFAAELRPVIDAWPNARLVASVRDVLVRMSDAKAAALVAAAAPFETIFVHADPAVVRLEDSFPQARTLADKLVYTGFVHDSEVLTAPAAADDGSVVVSAGGGAVGRHLMRAALDAAALLPERTVRILVSPQHGADRLATLQAAAPANAIVEPNRDDFRALLSAAALSISQAGYNTVLDVLAAGTRAIFVPFADVKETEQTDRAQALAARGRATVLTEATLTGQSLAAAARAALAASRPGPMALDRSGASRAAELILGVRRQSPAAARSAP